MIQQPPSAEPPVVSRLDTDRFCDHCGFNMRTLAVVRDPGTQLLVIRCTECGRHHAAAHTTPVTGVLVRRVAPLLTLMWIAALLGITGLLLLMQTAPQVALHEQLKARINGVQTLTIPPQTTVIMTVLSIIAAGTAMALVTLYTGACHHWRRWGYVALALAVPLVSLSLGYRAWMDDAPDLWPSVRHYVLTLGAVSFAGALAGAFLGRVLLRFVATLLLPPRLRSTLAHLWLADGKPPPRDV